MSYGRSPRSYRNDDTDSDAAVPDTGGAVVSVMQQSVASAAALSAAYRPPDADEVGRRVATSDVLPLPRNTQSAITAVKHARGLPAVLARWPIPKQHAIRQVCVERLDLLGRVDAVRSRFEEVVATGGGYADDKPDILRRLEDRLAENHEQLVFTLQGDREGARVIEDALEDEEYADFFTLPVASEDAAREAGAVLSSARSQSGLTRSYSRRDDTEHTARIWRRKLDTGKPSRKVLGVYGRPTHTHPNKHGDKTIWDQLDTAMAEGDSTKLSYYQRVQRRYGRQRRGSTAVAGAWEAVFGSKSHRERLEAARDASVAGESGHLRVTHVEGRGGGSSVGSESVGSGAMDRHAADVTRPGTGRAGRGGSEGEDVSVTAARAASHAAQRMNMPELAPRAAPMNGEALANDKAAQQRRIALAAREAALRSAAAASADGQDGDKEAFSAALRVIHAAKEATASALSPPSSVSPSQQPPPPAHGGRPAHPPVTQHQQYHHHHHHQQHAAVPVSSRSLPRQPPGAVRSSSSSHFLSSDGRSTGMRSAVTESARPHAESVGGFTTRDLEAVMPHLRHTPSALVSAARNTPKHSITAVFASLTLKAQRAGRLIVSELAELLSRYEAGFDRIQVGLGREPEDDELPEFMLQIDAMIGEKKKALMRAVGPAAAERLFDLASDEDTRKAMGLTAETEEMQEDEEHARMWRRQLARFKSVKFEGSNKPKKPSAEAARKDSGRDLFGHARKEALREGENVSYYERQQRKYGRGRRGSTAHVGAWAELFQEQAAAGGGDGVRVVHTESDLFM